MYLLFSALADFEPTLSPLQSADIIRAQQIAKRYAQFDFVDCCIMAQAERLNISYICTLDVRDFSQFRPKHTDHLTLLPEPSPTT